MPVCPLCGEQASKLVPHPSCDRGHAPCCTTCAEVAEGEEWCDECENWLDECTCNEPEEE